MDYNLTKSCLNLYAVIKNIEDLTLLDREMKDLTANWNLSIQFTVRKGPRGYIEFKNGRCSVGRGKCKRPSIILFFLSPLHFNKMFDGNANPIPLRGFSKIGFLTKEFPRLTDRLAYYLKPDDELLRDTDYLKINTIMTMNTAAFAIPEIAAGDPDGKAIASHIPDGVVELKILPDIHAVNITFSKNEITSAKGVVSKPSAVMAMKNIRAANDFLNGKTDPFTAIASGDVSIKGIIPMLDATGLLLDRIAGYIS